MVLYSNRISIVLFIIQYSSNIELIDRYSQKKKHSNMKIVGRIFYSSILNEQYNFFRKLHICTHINHIKKLFQMDFIDFFSVYGSFCDSGIYSSSFTTLSSRSYFRTFSCCKGINIIKMLYLNKFKSIASSNFRFLVCGSTSVQIYTCGNKL